MSLFFATVLVAGVLPCLILIGMIYAADEIEKEPFGLLLKIFLFGCFTTIPAAVLERIGTIILGNLPIDMGSPLYNALMMFLVVGVAEEGLKHLNTRLCTWEHPAFNYRFDGVVYSVMASLGFAAAENVMYIYIYGLTLAPVRALTSIPLHCICGVFMGHYYGQAKYYEQQGEYGKRKLNMLLSVVIPVLIHGFYDFCVTGGMALLVFLIFMVILDVVAFRAVRRYSKEDTPV